MIPGGGANGQYPNLSLGLPIPRTAQSATLKFTPTKLANARVQARKIVRLIKFPNSN